MRFRTLDQLEARGKRVLLRADLNVPLTDGQVTDRTRLERLRPTIRELCEKGAQVIICSHLGRPKGKPVSEMPLRTVAKALEDVLGRPVHFVSSCVGTDAEQAARSLAATVQATHKIRTFDNRRHPGGGGTNVARVVHGLGGDALALIMTGDVTGRLVKELLSEEGARWRAVPIRDRTRITLNVHDQKSGLEYRFVPEGPLVAPDEWRRILDVLKGLSLRTATACGVGCRG